MCFPFAKTAAGGSDVAGWETSFETLACRVTAAVSDGPEMSSVLKRVTLLSLSYPGANEP